MAKKEGLTPQERVMRARLGAYKLHATHDPKETTKAARQAFRNKFYEQTDPSLPEAERSRRAECLRKAHYQMMALKSARKRRAWKAQDASKAQNIPTPDE